MREWESLRVTGAAMAAWYEYNLYKIAFILEELNWTLKWWDYWKKVSTLNLFLSIFF